MRAKNLFVVSSFIAVSALVLSLVAPIAKADTCAPGVQGNAAKRIVWFAGGKGSGFWPMVENVLRATAADLGVTLEVYYSNENPLDHINQVEAALTRSDRPVDGVLFHNHKHRGVELLKRVEAHGVPAMLMNAGFMAAENAGRPRENYRCWIGAMLPDDEGAGYRLAKALIAEAERLPNGLHQGAVHMVGIEGDRASMASQRRVEGLKRALAERAGEKEKPPVVFHQYFHSKWKRDLAATAYKMTRARYPEVTVFWTAADIMGLGVVDAATEEGRRPGHDFVTGGMDLLPYTFEQLEAGNLTASVGAHYIEAAFALTALYDYLNGYDFGKTGKTQFSTDMAVRIGGAGRALPKDDAEIVRRLDRIDFSALSNAHAGRLKPYALDTQAVLDQLW